MTPSNKIFALGMLIGSGIAIAAIGMGMAATDTVPIMKAHYWVQMCMIRTADDAQTNKCTFSIPLREYEQLYSGRH